MIASHPLDKACTSRQAVHSQHLIIFLTACSQMTAQKSEEKSYIFLDFSDYETLEFQPGSKIQLKVKIILACTVGALHYSGDLFDCCIKFSRQQSL